MNRLAFWAFAATLCAMFGARGDGLVTANWLPTTAGTYSITNTSYWDTGFAPTNSEYVANFAPGVIEGAQNIDFPNSQSSWRLGTVYGALNQTIRTPKRHTNSTTIRYLEVANPNGFQGTWAFQDLHARFYLTPTNGLVPAVASFDCYHAPLLLTSPGTSVVERLVGGGLLHRGANNNDVQSNNVVVIKAVDPFVQSRTRIRMANHSVVSLDFDGPPTNLPVTAGVYVRFDASRADTIDTVEENGRRYVTAWRDAEGGSVTAMPYTGNGQNGTPHGQRPWLSDVTSVNGIPLVDFGAYENVSSTTEDADYDTLKSTLGPSASLVFTQTTQVREVFVAWQDTQAANTRAFVVGAPGNYFLHRDGTGYLLANYYSDYHVNDETYVDGILRSWKFGPYDFTKLTVASMNLSTPVTLGTLAQDRNIRFGGARIAEVIIYTRELTSMERRAVHAYLQRKWTWGGKAGPFMLRDIQVDSFDQPFEVTDGRTIDVGSIKVSAGQTFIKRGGGTLNVDTLANEGLKLRVDGGAVTFDRRLPDLDDSSPADDPRLWLDATVDDSFVRTNLENGVEGRDYIHRWNDRRPERTQYYAYPMSMAIDTNRPFVVANAANGHAVVDFGYGCITNSAVTNWTGSAFGAARLQLNANVSTYDAFVVFRMNNPDSYYDCIEKSGNASRGRPAFFGVDSQDFTRWGSDRLLAGFAGTGQLSAFWCIDGVSYVPYYDAFNFGTNDFHLVAFSQLNAIAINRLATERNITYGGMQIAEMLLYNRSLSERERRQTEAYLMKKWMNKVSPAMRETVKLDTVTFADGVEPVLASDRPLTVATLNAPTGATITQRGSGTVTLPPKVMETIRGYAADGGTLTVDMSDLFVDAFYHFDASDAESVVTEGETSNVTQWLDTRRNGMAAFSVTKGMSVAKPTLKTMETRNGKVMPVLDFGDVSLNKSTTSADSAGMDIRQNGADLGESAGCVKEIHVVYCDAGSNFDGYKQRFIFADHGRYPFHRSQSNGAMFGGANDTPYGQYVTGSGSYVALDGNTVPYNYNMTDRQFHVISAAPTNGVPVRSITRDRSARAGGSYQGELIAFKDYLSPTRRAYLQKYLMWKWLGEGTEPVYTNAVTELRVANGGTLAFTGAPTISAPALAGSGTVAAGRVVDVSSLAFDFTDETSYDQLTVNGALSLAASGTVSVTVGAGARTPGDYPLLTATALNGRLDGWTKMIANGSKLAATLVVQGNTLCLRLTPTGTLLFFR